MRMAAGELDALGGVMLKDETTCIRCAMCASRCPTHAITMKKFEFYRECVTVPTPNPKRFVITRNGRDTAADARELQ